MNLKQLQSLSTLPALSGDPLQAVPPPRGATPVWRHALSRRQFLHSAAGAAGLALAWGPGLAKADGSGDPVPIPGGIGGGVFRVFGPALLGPANQEPSTITNFNGFVGLAYINGMVTQTNTRTGQVRRLP